MLDGGSMGVTSSPPVKNIESMRIISNPVQYGPAGSIKPLTDQVSLEQGQSSAQSVDQPMQDSMESEAGIHKFPVFEPDSLVAKAHTDAIRNDSVAKLNDARTL